MFETFHNKKGKRKQRPRQMILALVSGCSLLAGAIELNGSRNDI